MAATEGIPGRSALQIEEELAAGIRHKLDAVGTLAISRGCYYRHGGEQKIIRTEMEGILLLLLLYENKNRFLGNDGAERCS